MAPPATSGPVVAQRLLKNFELTTLRRPPRTKMAPPPFIVSWPHERPFLKVRFWTVRVGWSWSWQWGVVHTCRLSQVFM